ncbi:heavy metal translocating P-type ATPase [Solibacillus sp. R5-41]|uniref:heavy metal translocating P-type ATPase n=1 Tax=Solibacillus sp. R5-41 TaxID=2048654 RepID=UPI000C12727B|nr:heavy metal translocating P-type ATPase [Solibacillus sp. R5-41]ATP42066.1 heavy metal translocating P-type ATPase [Solibacillus sp. R5-41]
MAQKTEQFRLENLSCANCAAKFERNIREISTVEEVQLNFGAAKLTVTGEVTVAQLEEAGAFDGIKVALANERKKVNSIPFYKRKENLLAAFSLIFVFFGLIASFTKGEGHLIANSLFAIAIVVGGLPIFKTGIKNLRNLEFDMKTLMTIAIIGAAIIGEWQEAAIVVFLFAVSEALEAYSMNKARQSISQLIDIAPSTALIKRAHGGHFHEMEVATENIQIGDILIVKPGQKIAMDGIVIEGVSTVNQSAITGESIPVTKTVEDTVFAGTLNEEGALEIKVTKRVEDTTIAKIIHLVEEAQAEKAPSQKFVDRFAKYYTPAIMLGALLVAVVPGFITGDWQHWIYQGLAVLVVGCPCALIISTPVAIVTAIGNAAKQGVLIKGGAYLEELGRIQAVAFDKTGTLTKGQPEVVAVLAEEGQNEQQLLAQIAAVEKKSQHPLARAILSKAFEQKVHIPSVENFQSVMGKGAYASVNGQMIYVGSVNWIQTIVPISPKLHHVIEKFASEGKSVIIAANETALLGVIAIADQVRDESKEVIKVLHENKIRHTVMLTGDASQTANKIAEELRIDDVRANLLPENKLQAMKELQQQYGTVAMIGDGVNDAPALAAANIGIAMGGAGTDAALETAQVVLMSDDLTKLPYTINLSKKTVTIIKQNIIFALGLKVIALLLVIPGWLTLWIAIFADMGATLLVILNSLRLLKMK